MATRMDPKKEVRERFSSQRDLSKICIIPEKRTSTTGKNVEKRKRRVAVYCRVSTDSVEQTTSFETQKLFYIDYVRKNPGWKLIGLYSDEGLSATTIRNRKGIQMLISDVLAGKIDLVIVKDVSRFCRNAEDFRRIVREFRSLPNPVEIYFESEHLSTADPAMDLAISLVAIFVEQESVRKSDMITGAIRQRMSEGLFLVPDSLGYTRTGVNKIGVDSEEAETVKLIYDMYFAGYSTKEIAQELRRLKRKKHTHTYVDGRVRAGGNDWTASSVEGILENEKKCGDVLAQKTYTYDCLAHKSRKNNNNVRQYYGMNLHEPIISRESFYLGLKIKNSNKGGWNKGIPILKVCTNGSLKGFVLSVPCWYGFTAADYIRGSLAAYGVELPEESIYPDYVKSMMNRGNGAAQVEATVKTSASDESHFYYVTEEEFNTSPEPSAEETEEEGLDKEETEEETWYGKVIEAVRKREDIFVIRADTGIRPVSGRMFNMSSKPLLTIDRNGLSFNTPCRAALQNECNENVVEVLYNPVRLQLCVRKCSDNGFPGKLQWTEIEGEKTVMKRCPSGALTSAVYQLMGWEKENRYKVPGIVWNSDGERRLIFDLTDPVICVKCKKKIIQEENCEGSRLEIAVESLVGYAGIESTENENEAGQGVIGVRSENRSRAVYFTNVENDREDQADKNETDDNSIPGLVIKQTDTDLHIMQTGWEDGFSGPTDVRIPATNNGEITYSDFGWTTHYDLPSKDDVQIRLEKMHSEIEF